MKLLNKTKIDEMLAAAKENPRLRVNFNFHDDLNETVNRLCIAALPGSPFAIQRHPDKWEMLCVVYGSLICRWHDDAGRVTQELTFGTGENVIIEIPAGTWHSLEVLTPCVFYEVKKGPYVPVAPEDTLAP